jgi:hypothetical protein
MGFNSPKISLLNTLNTVDFDGSFISGDDFAKTLANTNFGIIDGNIIIVGVVNIDGVGNESDSIWSIRSDNNISNYISLESGNSTQFVSSFEFGGLGEFDSELSGGNIRSWSGGPYLGNTIHTTICDFSGSDIYGRMNGTQRINISNEYFTEIDMSSSTFLINSNINETSKLDGLFGELMIFNSNDQSLAIKAEGYLAHKWSMTSLLPSGHPHKDSMP